MFNKDRPYSINRFRYQLLASGGFTLLELMIAIIIFSMISTAAYKLFMSVTKAQEVTQSALDGLDKLQRAEIVLEKDLFQMARRPIRDESGQQLGALKVPGSFGTLIEFTRSGWQNPLEETRSNLQRIAYALEDHQLIRYYWSVIDRAPGSARYRQIVLSGVEKVDFRFLDENKRWLSTWSPQLDPSLGTSDNNLSMLPRAVELKIVHETMGSMITIVPLSTYKSKQIKPANRLIQESRQMESGYPPSLEGHDSGY